MKGTRYQFFKLLLIILSGMFLAYAMAEHLFVWQIRNVLARRHVEGYAILNLHIGGQPVATPSLWRVLALLCKYECADEFQPRGSGGFTGKRNYLALLVSDNRTISAYNWSFRKFTLDEWPSADCDTIDNLTEAAARLYLVRMDSRIRRRGLWFCGEQFNVDNRAFYYRK
jgi:hypothetical protein